jgi:hypothetical protein
MPSSGERINANAERLAVRLANHLPFSKIGEMNIARAESKAKVAIVSAIPTPRRTDPLGLHKQQE